MKKSNRYKGYKKMIYEVAEDVSRSVESANEYMEKEGIDFDNLIASGMKSIRKAQKPLLTTKNKKLTKQQLYFRRVVLAAEITKKLYSEFTFGHVKFQKLMFLCEKICEYNLQDRYFKQAAGPMDNRFMHSIDKEFEKQNWFAVTKEGPYKKYIYKPLPGLGNQEKYYSRYFSKFDDKIQWLLRTLRTSKTDKVELIATIFACWEELIMENSIISDAIIIEKVYEWSKEKEKFSKEKIIETIRWMEANNLFPN